MIETRTIQTSGGDIIEVTRAQGQDASQLAAQVAQQLGTKLNSSIRWYGAYGPVAREVRTADGRTIRVNEPDRP